MESIIAPTAKKGVGGRHEKLDTERLDSTLWGKKYICAWQMSSMVKSTAHVQRSTPLHTEGARISAWAVFGSAFFAPFTLVKL